MMTSPSHKSCLQLERFVRKRTRKQPLLSLNHYFKIVCPQKLIRTEIHRSAIMQDFRDSKQKKNEKKNGRLAAISDFLV